MEGTMDDAPRRLEIEDRLAEMEHGLPGLLSRNDRAVQYLSRELGNLVEESREHRDSWALLNQRAEALLARLETASTSARGERADP